MSQPPTLKSESFASQRTLKGKQYRTGSLGRAIDDIYNDVDLAFMGVERSRQHSVTDLGNMTGNVTLTIAQLKTGIIHGDPNGSGRTLTLPTAALAVAGLSNAAVGDCVDFYIINEATTDQTAEDMTVAAGVGGSIIGSTKVWALVTANENSNTSKWRIRFTNVTASSEAYVCYRLA